MTHGNMRRDPTPREIILALQAELANCQRRERIYLEALTAAMKALKQAGALKAPTEPTP
jgi:hypothetical protein